jgi:hypothetical protein
LCGFNIKMNEISKAKDVPGERKPTSLFVVTDRRSAALVPSQIYLEEMKEFADYGREITSI